MDRTLVNGAQPLSLSTAILIVGVAATVIIISRESGHKLGVVDVVM